MHDGDEQRAFSVYRLWMGGGLVNQCLATADTPTMAKNAPNPSALHLTK